jgi:hypothetical protein
MAEQQRLTPEDRVRLIVGGNFSRDALGSLVDEVNRDVQADPAAHIRAFESLYLTGRPDRRAITDLYLGNFIARIRTTHPQDARRLVERLQGLMGSLARVQESEAAENREDPAATEISRQRLQLEQRRAELVKLLNPR